MCGIFGAVGAGVDERRGLDALRALAHRGPDGEGLRYEPFGEGRDRGGLFLGHRRLSIIDLSDAGTQPMSNEDGTLWLTFNGEIYNHDALRAELVAKGHVFRGHCDAEVILHLFEERGIECLDALHGMFAFGLWDARARTLWLARDRLGIKPLYWYHDGERLVFASELKAIRAYPGLDLAPDPTAYWDYLTYQFVPAPKTIYRRARKLPAAHWLRFDARDRSSMAREPEVRRWWDVAYAPREELTEADALGELAELLDDVVKEHLVSDVEVGAFLSGGFDSALVTEAAKRISGRAPRSFTIRFPERANDEARDAGATAAELGSAHEAIDFDLASLPDSVDRMPDLFDEPFADHSALPMVALCRHAAREVKVVLSGDGGDETHAGYSRYEKHERRELQYRRADRIPGLRALALATPARRLPWMRSVAEGPLGRPHAFHLGIPRETKRMLLAGASRDFDGYDDYWLVREAAPRGEASTLWRQQALDLATSLPDGILTKVDRTSMRFGLEVRPPLLDHRLVELAARLPDRLKLTDERGKRLLRALLERRSPSAAARARKLGFSIPLKRFVRDEGRFRLAGDVEVFDAFRIDRRKVERVLSPGRDSQKYWILAMLEQFLGAVSAGGGGAAVGRL